MSPTTKSKSKDKSAAGAVNELQQRVFSKLLTAPTNGGNGIPASAYNPVSGTFHTLEIVASAPSSAPLLINGRFQIIDETEEQYGNSNGTAEYDSNNDSGSGESEDQKEKAMASGTARLEAIPGCDSDKRDKIRQKNEKKHQRQRERRAQELHERCRGYLTTRKLDALSQQLVAMGFPRDRATLALVLNEGRVEESVAWLFEGGEERLNGTNLDVGCNLKIDVSEELAKIADLEVRFKCSKQDVERAIVACEGDLEKAAEALKVQKQEPPTVPPKPEESVDPAVALKGGNKVAISTQNSITRTQVKAVASVTAQQQRDERDFNFSKAVVAGAVPLESGNKNLQQLRMLQLKPEWTRPQVATSVDKRWPSASTSPSVYSLGSSPLQVAVPTAKAESCYTTMVGTEVKTNSQAGALREPVIVMQRPQSINVKQNPSSSVGVNALPPVTTGWYLNGLANTEMMRIPNGGLGHKSQNASLSTSSPSPALQYCHLNRYQPFTSSSADAGAAGKGGTWNTTRTSTGPTPTSSSLAVPPSLGLFTGWGSAGTSGSSPPVDWSTGGLTMQCDYNNIDWSLDSTPPRPKLGPSSKSDRVYDTRAAAFMGAEIARPGINGGSVYIDGGLAVDPSSSTGPHEWTSPFAGKDLLRVPRHYVTSPSL